MYRKVPRPLRLLPTPTPGPVLASYVTTVKAQKPAPAQSAELIQIVRFTWTHLCDCVRAHTPAHTCSSLQSDLLYVTTGEQDVTAPTRRAPSGSRLQPPRSLPLQVPEFLAAADLFFLPIMLFR